MEATNLNRFIEAQENTFQTALSEIEMGSKQGHWMWFIFPQIAALGFSETSRFYALTNIAEASAYLAHPVLGKRLIEISSALFSVEGKTAKRMFGSPDDLKLQSCMTLFATLPDTNPVFKTVLDEFFEGIKDPKTLALIQAQP